MAGSLERMVGSELETNEIHLLIYDQRGESQAAAFHLIFGWILAQLPRLPSTVLAHAPEEFLMAKGGASAQGEAAPACSQAN